MSILGALAGIFRRGETSVGIWGFFSKLADGRARIALERARNEGTQRAIELMSPGMELREGSPNWIREIRMPLAAAPAVLIAGMPTKSPPPAEPTAISHTVPEPPAEGALTPD
jgi:hypothetical protein